MISSILKKASLCMIFFVFSAVHSFANDLVNGKMIKGKIGKDLKLEDGQAASKLCVANIIAQAKKAMNGDLNKIKNCVKITGFVNSADNFIDQPKIINPASEALSAVFGESGKHTRAAVSTNSLPLGVAVEIDAIFEIL